MAVLGSNTHITRLDPAGYLVALVTRAIDTRYIHVSPPPRTRTQAPPEMPLLTKIKRGARRLRDLVHLPSGDRTPEQPSTPSANDSGQRSPSQPINFGPVSPSPGPNKPPAPSPERSAKNAAWAALKTSLGLLQESAKAFGPLKTAVGGISGCIEIFEVCRASKHTYLCT